MHIVGKLSHTETAIPLHDWQVLTSSQEDHAAQIEAQIEACNKLIDYFVSILSRYGGDRGRTLNPDGVATTKTGDALPAPSSIQIHLPYQQRSGLRSFAIPEPLDVSEIPRVLDNLRSRKAQLEGNQT